MGLKKPRQLQLLDQRDQQILAELANGLSIESRPYATLARQLGLSEAEVVNRIRQLIEAGVIKRYGVVVRHRELGYRANGMVVWDVPDNQVRALGQRLSGFPCVTLCYRRPRYLPDWPYNLFTMIHGHNREQVLEKFQEIVVECHLHHIPSEILFSTRRFKQRGANYQAPTTPGLSIVKPGAGHDQ